MEGAGGEEIRSKAPMTMKLRMSGDPFRYHHTTWQVTLSRHRMVQPAIDRWSWIGSSPYFTGKVEGGGGREEEERREG